MKKSYLYCLVLLILFVVLIQKVHSQRGDLSFDLVPSYKTNGYGVNINANYSNNATDYFQLSLVAAFSREQPDSTVDFPHEDYLLNIGYFTTILTWPNRSLSIFFGGGASVGYENINKGENNILIGFQIPGSGIVYGGYASFEMDFFLTNSLSLTVPINGIYHFNSKVAGNSMVLLGAGIRYYLK